MEPRFTYLFFFIKEFKTLKFFTIVGFRFHNVFEPRASVGIWQLEMTVLFSLQDSELAFVVAPEIGIENASPIAKTFQLAIAGFDVERKQQRNCDWQTHETN